jgi:hypothetical protein
MSKMKIVCVIGMAGALVLGMLFGLYMMHKAEASRQTLTAEDEAHYRLLKALGETEQKAKTDALRILEHLSSNSDRQSAIRETEKNAKEALDYLYARWNKPVENDDAFLNMVYYSAWLSRFGAPVEAVENPGDAERAVAESDIGKMAEPLHSYITDLDYLFPAQSEQSKKEKEKLQSMRTSIIVPLMAKIRQNKEQSIRDYVELIAAIQNKV